MNCVLKGLFWFSMRPKNKSRMMMHVNGDPQIDLHIWVSVSLQIKYGNSSRTIQNGSKID